MSQSNGSIPLQAVIDLFAYVERSHNLTAEGLINSLGGNPIAFLCQAIRDSYCEINVNDLVRLAFEEGVEIDCSWKSLSPFVSMHSDPQFPEYAVSFFHRMITKDTASLRIIDPQAGNGAFLMCALDAGGAVWGAGRVENAYSNVAECISKTSKNVEWWIRQSHNVADKSDCQPFDLLISIDPDPQSVVADLTFLRDKHGTVLLVLSDDFSKDSRSRILLEYLEKEAGLMLTAFISFCIPGSSSSDPTRPSKNQGIGLASLRRLDIGGSVFLAALCAEKAHNEAVWKNLSCRRDGLNLTEGRLVSSNEFNGFYFEYIEQNLPRHYRTVKELLGRTELELRQLIRAKYEARWKGSAELRMCKAVGESEWQTVERNRDKYKLQYRSSPEPRDILQFCTLGQLQKLIENSDAWSLFTRMFKDKRELEDLFRAIIPQRNDMAHLRDLPDIELLRCEVACRDILNIIQKELGRILTEG